MTSSRWLVRDCPWTHGLDQCLGALCAEFGPRGRITASEAAGIVASLTGVVNSGFLGDNPKPMPLSLDRSYRATCPRSVTEALAKALGRSTLAGRVELYIDGHTAYAVVAEGASGCGKCGGTGIGITGRPCDSCVGTRLMSPPRG